MSVNKLKHIALKEIHYRLLNTVLIIHTEAKEYCHCYAFSGCRQKPHFQNLAGARNYCYICRLICEYLPNRVERLRSIQETWQLYLKLNEDLTVWKKKASIGFTLYPCFWNKNYTDKLKEYRSQLFKKIAVREYMHECYNYLVWLDP